MSNPPNNNNEFEPLDDPFASSGVGMDDAGLQDGGTPVDANGDGTSENSPFGDSGLADTGNALDSFPSPASEPLVNAKEEVRYKTPRPDLFLVLLFISWAALLIVIGLLWFECHPSEYGEVPYKESSRPVVNSSN